MLTIRYIDIKLNPLSSIWRVNHPSLSLVRLKTRGQLATVHRESFFQPLRQRRPRYAECQVRCPLVVCVKMKIMARTHASNDQSPDQLPALPLQSVTCPLAIVD